MSHDGLSMEKLATEIDGWAIWTTDWEKEYGTTELLIVARTL